MTVEFFETEQMAEKATTLLKALAHPARLLICCQLREREMSVGDMEKTLDIRQPRLSRELAKLRDEGLVETRRESKVVFYRLSDGPYIGEMVDAICAVMHGKDDTAPVAEVPAKSQQRRRRPNPSGGYGMFVRRPQS